MSDRSFSPRTLRALAVFGITTDAARASFDTTTLPAARRAAACVLRTIRHAPGPVLLAGPSGAGKSTALRLIDSALRKRRIRRIHTRLRLRPRDRRTPVDLVRGTLAARLSALARVGLADATILALPAMRLSEGQKWRLALVRAEGAAAAAVARRTRAAVLADEFCAGLDLAAARPIVHAAAHASRRAAPLIAATSREDLIAEVRAAAAWTVIDLQPQGEPCTSTSNQEPSPTTKRSPASTTAPGRRRRSTSSSAPRAARAAAKPSASSSSLAPSSTRRGARRSGPTPHGQARPPVRHDATARNSSTSSSAPSAASSSIPAAAASASPPGSSARTSRPRAHREPKPSPRCPGSAASSARQGCEKSRSGRRDATGDSAAPSAMPGSSPGDSSMPAASSGSPSAAAADSKRNSGDGQTTPAPHETPREEASRSSSPTPREPSPVLTPAAPTDSMPKSPSPPPPPPPVLTPLTVASRRAIELDPEKPPRTPHELGAMLREVLGISIPARALRDSSGAAPLDYLSHTFFEGRRFEHADPASDTRDPTDCVVWANRGGGKTFLGAVATMLDLVYKPGIQVRILGGSLEQSKRMQEHLARLFEHERLAPLLRPGRAGRAARSITLENGSRAEVLAASETSVRGVRVQKVRCDEVELFDPALWRAVQLTTRSLAVSGPWGSEVRGGIEALSTMHLPYGIMWDLVGAGVGGSGELPAATPLRRLFRWGLIDALERCDDPRPCESCNLFDDCRGRAKSIAPGAGGHIRIADARSQKRRVDVETWRSEMLCLEPRTHDLVYPDFDPRIHIIGMAGDEAMGTASLRGETSDADTESSCITIAGMDFGFRAETAILIGRLRASDNTIFIDHEIVASQRTMARHIDSIAAYMQTRGGVGAIRWLAADPAGRSRNDQTGADNIALLNQAGIRAIGADNAVEPGIRRVRSRLAPADGPR